MPLSVTKELEKKKRAESIRYSKNSKILCDILRNSTLEFWTLWKVDAATRNV